ncbi:MAG: hypothetical protein P1Q69_18730 [Candidatus Thorarchaeota archaeon]|nr:hypothetical protein [Candidatus Thorarchaeota archaeon]
MATARKAVDSTLKRILVYTAEIIASIILLVVICLPLAFTIPMWIQRVALGTSIADLWVNPAIWFGATGALIVTILLAVVSLFFGYPYVMKLIPSVPKGEMTIPEDEVDDEPDEEVLEVVDDETEEDEEEEIVEDVEGVESSEENKDSNE